MKKTAINFMIIAVVAAIMLVVVIVFADEGTIRAGSNALINWIATLFGLPEPNIF